MKNIEDSLKNAIEYEFRFDFSKIAGIIKDLNSFSESNARNIQTLQEDLKPLKELYGFQPFEISRRCEENSVFFSYSGIIHSYQ